MKLKINIWTVLALIGLGRSEPSSATLKPTTSQRDSLSDNTDCNSMEEALFIKNNEDQLKSALLPLKDNEEIGDVLIIKAHNLNLSDVTDILTELDNPCNIPVKLKAANILVSNTIFIDTDFDDEGSELQLSIIAPKWVIIGERKINLDGLSKHESSKANKAPKEPGTKGYDGRPGLSGGAAGTFLGIGMVFEYINTPGEGSEEDSEEDSDEEPYKMGSLTITANGGHGGPGQNGSDGADGCYIDQKIYPNSMNCSYNSEELSEEAEEELYHGSDGGNGGAGGFGGPKGEILMINLNTSSNQPTQLIIEAVNGSTGEDGKGGAGGSPNPSFIENEDWHGTNGIDGYNDVNQTEPETAIKFQSIPKIMTEYEDFVRPNFTDSPLLPEFLKEIRMNEVLESSYDVPYDVSYNVFDLINEFDVLEEQYHTLREKQRPDLIYFYQSISKKVINYARNFEIYHQTKIENVNFENATLEIQKQISGDFGKTVDYMRGEVRQFSQELPDLQKCLDNVTTVLKSVDSNSIIIPFLKLALKTELKKIKAELRRSKSQIIEKYLNRFIKMLDIGQGVVDYSKKIDVIDQAIDKADQDLRKTKIVLSFIYTAVLSKISNIKANSQARLIIDIHKYLNLIELDIQKLKAAQEKKEKYLVISRFKNNYKSAIDKKIEEAGHFIENQIIPELDNIFAEIEQKIDLLLDEVIELQRDAKRNREALEKKRRELKEALIIRTICGVFNNIGKALFIFGPKGILAGSLISGSSQLVENLLLGKRNDYEVPNFEIPEGVVSGLENANFEIQNQILGDFRKTVDYMRGEVRKYEQELSDLQKYLNNVTTILKKKGSNNLIIHVLKQELKIKLTKTKSELRRSKSQIIEKWLNRCIKMLDFGQGVVDTYLQFKDDSRKIEEIDQAIAKNDQDMRKIQQYSSRIYDTLIPALDKMESNIKGIANQLENKSHVVLDMTKWKIQSALKETQFQIKQFTEGFKVQAKFARCIEKLMDAMTVLIDVYDRIQNFQDQKQLADYLADISSADVINAKIDNETLDQALQDLEIVIISNLILESYKYAIGALKQQVFPMAHQFLDEHDIPPQLEMEQNLENLVNEAIRQVEVIKSKTLDYEAVISPTHADSNSNHSFNGNYNTTRPFFIWKNEEHKAMIHELLSGQRVTVKADISDSHPDKDAIKFNEIQINFNSSDPELHSKLQDILIWFKVTAVHLGCSYYRFNDDIYQISSNSQKIQFSFEKHSDGTPIHKNDVYVKLKNGSAMLSPYALWEFQLLNLTQSVSYEDLASYKDVVDLELIGVGSYLNHGTDIPEVGRYYQANKAL